MNRHSAQAFTLPQLLAALALAGIVSAFALNSFQKHRADAKLREAQAALLDNALFLQKHYAKHHTYTRTSTEWPELPHPQTADFCIRFQGLARGQPVGKFTLKAVAFDQAGEPRVLRLSQNGTILVCRSSRNSCSEGNIFSGGSANDQNCTPYR